MPRVTAISESVKVEVLNRLASHAKKRWPTVRLEVSWRGRLAYVSAFTASSAEVKLCRLGYVGLVDTWEFAFFKYSSETYAACLLPSGSFTGTLEDCLDCAGMYLDEYPD